MRTTETRTCGHLVAGMQMLPDHHRQATFSSLHNGTVHMVCPQCGAGYAALVALVDTIAADWLSGVLS